MEAIDSISHKELEDRWDRVRMHMARDLPEAQGIMVMSRTLMYWLTGHWGNGVFWLPAQGEPVLMVRKGLERAKLESPVQAIFPFRSLGQVPKIVLETKQTMPQVVGLDMDSISWSMGQSLSKRMENVQFQPADRVLAQARAVKSEWELGIMQLAGERHDRVLAENIGHRIEPGMSERDIAGILWNEMFALGHQGQVRMNGVGEELYVGVISVGDSGNYPTVSSGPVGYRGAHPGVPQMGYAGQILSQGHLVTIDTVFQLEGYHTDKSQVYFAGKEQDIPTELKEAHGLCQQIYGWLADNLRPGAKPSELCARCQEMVREQGWESGFMGLKENKVPFIGHGIGIFVDDWPVIAHKFDLPLEEDMVLALEPKIGLEGYGMVGVENTCRVTPQGGVSMTGQAGDIICLQ